MKHTDTHSWYSAMARTSWSREFGEDGALIWYNELAMNQRAPSKCDQIFAEFCVNAFV